MDDEFVLNDEQMEFVKGPLNDVKLMGIPGGGKTTSMIYKLIKLLKIKELNKKTEFMVLTFGRDACKNFIEKGNVIKNGTFGKTNCKTLHSLAGTLINLLLGRKCSSLQTTIISAVNVLKNTSRKKLRSLRLLKPLKLLMVDEAQDISDIQYELITLLKKKLRIKLILVGDPNQNIHQFQNGSDAYIMEYDVPIHHLKKNNRSSPQIVNFINYFRPWADGFPEMESTRKNSPIKPLIYCNSHDNIIEHILAEIKSDKWTRHKIAIIGPVKKSKKMRDGTYVNSGLQAIANALDKHGIPYVKHYNDTTDDGDGAKVEQIVKKHHVNLYTIHGSKGLEFDKVFVLNFHTSTFGTIPSARQYAEFKYLWYVALSRARDSINIYAIHGKNIWYGLNSVPKDLYEVEGKIKLVEPKFSTEIPSASSITTLLHSKKYFDEAELLEFAEMVNWSCTSHELFDVPDSVANVFETDDCSKPSNVKVTLDKYPSLFACYVKIICEFHFQLVNLKKFDYVLMIKNFASNIIIVNEAYGKYLNRLFDKLGCTPLDTISVDKLISIRNRLDRGERRLYNHIMTRVSKVGIETFSLGSHNPDVFFDVDIVIGICDGIMGTALCEDKNWLLFKLCLFAYQYEHEAKYLWKNKMPFKECVDVITPLINKIIFGIVPLLNKHSVFRKECSHQNMELCSTIDVHVPSGRNAVIKFSSDINMTAIAQAFLERYCTNPTFDTNPVVEVWNFKTGTRNVYTCKPTVTSFELLSWLARITEKRVTNTVFLYDLETTGLDQNYCQVIERYVHEMSTNSVISSGVIKPTVKVSREIKELTGITDRELKKGQNIDLFRNEIDAATNMCVKPLFIAHNGNVFDHKIMKRLDILKDHHATADSRIIIRQMSTSNIGKLNLSEIYKLIMGTRYKGKAHRARADVMMLVDIFAKLDIDSCHLRKFMDS